MGIVLPEGVFNNPSLSYVREFIEDRALLRAVISLPQETFISTGASVKCSLLFLQKFTEKEKQRFDNIYAKAKAQIESKYANDIAKETKRLETAIEKAKNVKKAERRKTLQKELKNYIKEIKTKKSAEARQFLKERFNYPIFMYEAENVGISATGEEDQNELYPNPDQPQSCDKTCLEWYREFLADPKAFAEAYRGIESE